MLQLMFFVYLWNICAYIAGTSVYQQQSVSCFSDYSGWAGLPVPSVGNQQSLENCTGNMYVPASPFGCAGFPTSSGTVQQSLVSPGSQNQSDLMNPLKQESEVWRVGSIANLRRKALEHATSMSGLSTFR